MLSSFTSPEYTPSAVALGAAGFLLKTSPTMDVLAAVAIIADGGLACTPEQLRVSRNAAWGSLTGREREVLDGVVQGRSNDEIGGDLGLSKKSVEAYCERARNVQRDRREECRDDQRQPSTGEPSRPEGTWARIR